MKGFLALNKSEKQDFYRFKLNYFNNFNFMVVIIAVLSSVTYFVSDCQLFGRFATETVVPRFSILISLAVYIVWYQRTDNIHTKIILSHIMGHGTMWHTIWAIHYLENRNYACPGFLIIQMVILVLGFASPFWVASISQLLIIVSIIVSSLFMVYPDVELMLSLGIPLAFGAVGVHYVLTQAFYETYTNRNKLEKMSYIDQLTNVNNRHRINQITKDKKLIQSPLEDISLAILDIDFFKKVNDTYGHDEGDIILKELAETLKENVRRSDIIIRWGGEEFVIIFYGCNEREAYGTCEKIRACVEEKESAVCKITISMGIVEYHGEELRYAIEKADKALYYAKETGRNRVIKYSNLGQAYT